MQYKLDDLRAGMQLPVAPGSAMVLPDFDYETYSAAGVMWNPITETWVAFPGLAKDNKGLKAVGVRNYVQHPEFEVLSLSWDLKDGKGNRWWRPDSYFSQRNYPRYNVDHGVDGTCAIGLTGMCDCGNQYHPDELIQHIYNGGMIEAFHIDFEWTVWEFFCVPFWGWPSMQLENMRCCMAKGKTHGLPASLANVGEVLKLTERKDPEGDKLIRKLTMPKSPTKANPQLRWTPFTATEDFEKFYAYNRQDIRTEAEASSKIADQTPHELEVWRTHFKINARGMQIDVIGVENCIAIIEQCYAKYNAELQRLTGYTVSNTSEVQKILLWMNSQGVYLPNLDEDTLEEHLKRGYPPAVLRVMKLRQMLAYGSVKKLYALRYRTTKDHRLCNQYEYYGTHTGLWNGKEVQPANLYSGIFKKPEEAERALSIISTRCLELVEYEYPDNDPLEIVASCLRSLIIARPGCRLISADFSAIQAVATACMAGEQWRIDVFKTHGKIYEMMAALLKGRTLEFYLDYRKQHKKHHEERQDFGKIPVLSADFGAWINGWKQFGADKLGDDNYIKQLILKTRATIPNIVEFWGGQTRNKFGKAPDGSYADECSQLYGLEGAAISAILEPGNCFAYRNVAYQMHEDILYCRPPSGGMIEYHRPRLERSTRDYASPWELSMSYEGWNSNQKKGKPGWLRMNLYGGVQTQNVISHECREIQALTLMRLDNNGYPVVMHTHDENVCEIPEGQGNIDEYMKLVRQLPAWASFANGEAWPIRVPDAWEAQRYGKWELD